MKMSMETVLQILMDNEDVYLNFNDRETINMVTTSLKLMGLEYKTRGNTIMLIGEKTRTGRQNLRQYLDE